MKFSAVKIYMYEKQNMAENQIYGMSYKVILQQETGLDHANLQPVSLPQMGQESECFSAIVPFGGNTSIQGSFPHLQYDFTMQMALIVLEKSCL